ncbi:MAG: 4Fe-4S binding protein [Planctomycetota bacterium]|nr:4Fe-4S binding protein [Planctomycetota bacterium]
MAINHYLSGNASPGPVRRLLRVLGPSWEAAPVRRLIQAAAFALFLVLFAYVAWPYGSKNYATFRESKELIDAESFLALDPLVSLSTALAARVLVWSLAWAAVLLAVCLVFPRGFCGYLCPLGTLVDLSDWVLLRRIGRKRPLGGGWWRHTRYGLLAASLAAAGMGVLLTGFVAAIPVLVRGMAFIVSPVELGLAKDWYLVPQYGAEKILSVALFAGVLGLGLVAPRFWCRYLCPSGAVFSVVNLLRLTERRVDASCIKCGKCVKACPFDAINPDFSTRGLECTFCQTCGGACPVHAINFTARWAKKGTVPFSGSSEKGAVPFFGLGEQHAETGTVPFSQKREKGTAPVSSPAFLSVPVSRRGLLGGAACGVACGVEAAVGVRGAGKEGLPPLVRPPGSVPEPEFLQMCIRCGECYQACPNNVLQPVGFERPVSELWTPQAVANWSGCEPSCNNCGHVCPTGAIRPLPMEEKRAAHMGLAVINHETCLPYIGFEGNCRMCADECTAAGYEAIDMVRINVALDTDGKPIEGSGNLVPIVDPSKCTGCGLCQTRCHKINVVAEKLLDEEAVRVEAGPGKEDRLMTGSYVALREAQRKKCEADRLKREGASGAKDSYLPDFLK